MARLFRRPKRGWWHGLAGWTLALMFTLPSGELAVPVSQYAETLALPATLAGLAIALAATVGFFTIKRHRWLLAAPLSFGLCFSFALSLIEGWETQIKAAVSIAQVAVGLGSIGLAVTSFVVMGRRVRRLTSLSREVTREVGDHLSYEGLFREDGERIMVFANRGDVAVRALTSMAVLAILVVGGLWARAIVSSVFVQIALVIGASLLLCFGGVSIVLMLVRLVITGILDNGSLIVTGRGLLRWNETLDVQEFRYSPNRTTTHRYLGIIVTDPRAVNHRQSTWKRALSLVVGQRQVMGFRIARPLLDCSPAVLATEIKRYIHSHAPEGSWHKATSFSSTPTTPSRWSAPSTVRRRT